MKEKNWVRAFKNEFGIHFKNSPDELKFVIVFVDELLKEANPKWKDIKGLKID